MEQKQCSDQTSLQKFVRACQYGVIGSLESFFTWYGTLVATYPVTAIVTCVAVTVAGGLGLFRFREEGDAVSLVIPRDSEFRYNIDWLDNNFPREIRVHSAIYTADNVLTPQVIQTIYRQRKELGSLRVGNKSFEDFCIQVPIMKLPDEGFAACQRKTDPDVNRTTMTTPHSQSTLDPWKGFGEMEDWDDGWNDEWLMGNNTVIANETWGEGSGDPGDPGFFAPLFDYLLPKPSMDDLEKWSDDYYPELYCGCIEATETACFEQNIVELWADQGSYSEVADKKIADLTQQEIIDTINNKNISQIFLKDFNFTDLLGGIQRNRKGEIIGAKAVEMKFFTSVNVTAVKVHGTATRGEKIDVESFNFEGLMKDFLQSRDWFPQGLTSYVNIQRMFFDSFVGQTFKDSDKLGLGYMLVFIYVNVMLSKLNFVEQRIWLSVIGILSVAMGMVLSYGLCSMFGLFYSAAHTVIPFLLLGIGIDNIFVITQTFNTLESTSAPAALTERFGQTMRHAGVAVSVTTFTDVIAFFVGANTVLPGLQSFCIYAAVAIFSIYALQVTHFVAWFSLDQRRQNARRDGCLCCYTHKDFKGGLDFSKESLMNKVFGHIGRLLTKWYAQLFVISLTVGFIVVGIWGTLSLTQEYNPEWLLPPESEVAQWFGKKGEFYPRSGEPGYIMISQIDIPKEFHLIENLVNRLEAPSERWNIDKVIPWHTGFRTYVNKFKKTNATFDVLMKNETYFREKFTQFLYSPRGAIFQPNFWFSEPLRCGDPAPDVLLQAIPIVHNRFYSSSVWIPAMENVKQFVKETPFSNHSFPMALTYINWETDAIVGIELIRNVGIALVCIFVTSLATLGSWRGSIFVMMCVLFTCIDVSGFMHWWGLTIDITSMNIIIISVGLCVDFCAHIVHGFLTGRGKKEERVIFIMTNIAPAVMNGGFSSLLALSLLVTSKSHIFVSFFKIFFMICVFGLFHGLILLPVVLCLIGPVDEKDSKEASTERKVSVADKPQISSKPLFLKKHTRAHSKDFAISNIDKEVVTTETNGFKHHARAASWSVPLSPLADESVRYTVENRRNMEEEGQRETLLNK